MRRPTKSLLDPTFRYTSSQDTNLTKTFARVRRELAKKAIAIDSKTVIPITKATGGKP